MIKEDLLVKSAWLWRRSNPSKAGLSINGAGWIGWMDSTEDKSPSAEWCPASWHLVHLDRRRNHLHEAVSWQKRELCTVFIDWTNPKWWALNIPVTSLGRARLAPPPSAFLVDSNWLVDIRLLDYVSYMFFFFPLTCFSSPYLISYHNMQAACNRNSKVTKI